MPFAENIVDFFDDQDFAVVATYTPQVGVEKQILGIFDNEYLAVAGGMVDVSGENARFTCAFADISDVKFGDSLSIDSIDYKIVGIEPDGTGVTTLVLEENDHQIIGD